MRKGYAGIGLGLLLSAALATGCESANNGKDHTASAGSGGGSQTASASAGGMQQKSLYERLGGAPAVKAVCDDFVARAAANPKVDFFRKSTPGAEPWNPSPEELATFNKHLVQFVSKAAGAPVQYEGQDMKSVHEGMKISEEQFNAIAADLAASLDKFNVPAKEKNELLSIVASTKSQMVEAR
jgi:hemoglobin